MINGLLHSLRGEGKEEDVLDLESARKSTTNSWPIWEHVHRFRPFLFFYPSKSAFVKSQTVISLETCMFTFYFNNRSFIECFFHLYFYHFCTLKPVKKNPEMSSKLFGPENPNWFKNNCVIYTFLNPHNASNYPAPHFSFNMYEIYQINMRIPRWSKLRSPQKLELSVAQKNATKLFSRFSNPEVSLTRRLNVKCFKLIVFPRQIVFL